MSHTYILDIDRGHIFRKHRHKNNRKSCCYLRENGKKPAVARVFARQFSWSAYSKSAISHVCCAYAHIFDAESTRTYLTRKALRANGNAGFRLTCRLPHCRFDDDICTTAQAPLAAEG